MSKIIRVEGCNKCPHLVSVCNHPHNPSHSDYHCDKTGSRIILPSEYLVEDDCPLENDPDDPMGEL